MCSTKITYSYILSSSLSLVTCLFSSSSIFLLHFLVFHHYYHGPILTTTNKTLVLQQINEILDTAKNKTDTPLEHHNETGVMSGHAESIFLPESLVLCTRERPILCLLLMLGTLWLGYTLYLIKRRYCLFTCCFTLWISEPFYSLFYRIKIYVVSRGATLVFFLLGTHLSSL